MKMCVECGKYVLEPEDEVMRPTLGWECPRCHRTYSPSITTCQHCGPKIETTANAMTIGDKWFYNQLYHLGDQGMICPYCHIAQFQPGTKWDEIEAHFAQCILDRFEKLEARIAAYERELENKE